MSAEQIPGQMSMTAGEIREALDRIESGYPDEESWIRPLLAIEDAALVEKLAGQLLAEQVATARSYEHETKRIRPNDAGPGPTSIRRPQVTYQGRSRDKGMFGWDVIGGSIGISADGARKRFGR